MLVYERDEHPVYVEFLLHYSPYQGRIGIFAYSVFAVIVGFDVKRHRATPPLAEIWGPGNFAGQTFSKPLSALVFSPGFMVLIGVDNFEAIVFGPTIIVPD